MKGGGRVRIFFMSFIYFSLPFFVCFPLFNPLLGFVFYCVYYILFLFVVSLEFLNADNFSPRLFFRVLFVLCLPFVMGFFHLFGMFTFVCCGGPCFSFSLFSSKCFNLFVFYILIKVSTLSLVCY